MSMEPTLNLSFNSFPNKIELSNSKKAIPKSRSFLVW